MNSTITYIHDQPASLYSKLLQLTMVIFGMKREDERFMTSQKYPQKPARIPRSLKKKSDFTTTQFMGHDCWTFKPQQTNRSDNKVIVYLHGGSYIANMLKYHWNLVEALMVQTGATMVVPDYPLAPVATWREVFEFMHEVYADLITQFAPEDIIFMGDSAGGGLALAFAQTLRKEDKPQPGQLILLGPWLDITMSNPDIQSFDKVDKMLGLKGLILSGKAYAGDLDPCDYRLSPIFGDFSGLGKISIFTGTHDLLIADARKMKAMLENANIPFNYFEYPKMFHVWMVITGMKEARHAIGQIAKLVGD